MPVARRVLLNVSRQAQTKSAVSAMKAFLLNKQIKLNAHFCHAIGEFYIPICKS